MGGKEGEVKIAKEKQSYSSSSYYCSSRYTKGQQQKQQKQEDQDRRRRGDSACEQRCWRCNGNGVNYRGSDMRGNSAMVMCM